MIAALVTDLIFRSRIAATARAAEVTLRVVGRLEDVTMLLAAGDLTLLIVDMDGPEALASIRLAAEARPRPRIVAYFAHVQTALAQQASEAGADTVLPRSIFVQRLPDLLRLPGQAAALQQ
ncbi:MAG: hypothetical protein HKL95_09640 [Phycisphaerae bacterium]|nr:hypothetical protein [Phycisphaerae bacterium]